jgi:glycosyltransferase involved in cell wall biosynthesis
MGAPGFTVVIPCYNEETAIEGTIAALRAALPDSADYAIVVVNDGSTDRTGALLRALAAHDSRLHVVEHPRNRGYGAALKSGIRHTESEFVVITDADGTYPIDRIPELVAAAAGADMVVGSRTAADVVYPLIRKIPKVVLKSYASWLSRCNIPDLNSGMRVIRRTVVERFLPILPDTFSFTTTITIAMHTNGYEVLYHPIGYAARRGKSKIRPVRDTLRFVKLIVRTGTYFAPMRVFFPVAFLLFVAFLASLMVDVFFYRDLTEKTLLLILFSMNTGMFALLADMIDKRSPR